MALRLRKEGEDWVQTFKAAGKNHLHRIEAEVDLGICSEEPELPDLNFLQNILKLKLFWKIYWGTGNRARITV